MSTTETGHIFRYMHEFPDTIVAGAGGAVIRERARGAYPRIHGKAPELDDIRVGELLPPRTGRPGLLGHQQPFDETAATVALPEAQGEKREVRALPEPPAVETLRPDLP